MTTLTKTDVPLKADTTSQNITSSIIEFAEVISLWAVTAAIVLSTSLIWVN